MVFNSLAWRLQKLRTSVRARLGIDTEHQVAPGLSIALPAGHMLPHFQTVHRDYDRFLPHLARYLPAGAMVIDVGANCGDTLAAMHVANPALRFTCIEPSQRFDAYLRRNLARLQALTPDLDVTIINAMVGKAISGAALVTIQGTAKQVVGTAGDASTTLDAMITPDDRAAVRLLKSDIDGFDYDALDSADAVIAAAQPLLFFECQLDHDFQRDGYIATITALGARGYRHWAVFDNFGAVMLADTDAATVVALLGYLSEQNRGAATRTLHYFDLLASTDADAALAARVIADYSGQR
jgi:FkbM family methyltransferase